MNKLQHCLGRLTDADKVFGFLSDATAKVCVRVHKGIQELWVLPFCAWLSRFKI